MPPELDDNDEIDTIDEIDETVEIDEENLVVRIVVVIIGAILGDEIDDNDEVE